MSFILVGVENLTGKMTDTGGGSKTVEDDEQVIIISNQRAGEHPRPSST